MPDQQMDQIIDIDALSLFSEVEDINPEANFNDQPPLPPEFDGSGAPIRYLTVMKLIQDAKTGAVAKPKQTNQGKPYLMLSLDFLIEDEGMPWHGTGVRSWPSTMVGRAGTSEIDSLLKALTGAPGLGMSHGQKVQTVLQYINAGKPVRITGRWEAAETLPKEEREAGAAYPKPFVRGMINFPKRALPDGSVVYEELENNPDTGKPCQTNFRITGYWPV